jgi:hypothetical protein
MKMFIITCMAILFIVSGCGDRCLGLAKVSNQKNTFELKGEYNRIWGIALFEISDPNAHRVNVSNLVWSARATKWVGGSTFRVTVPKIPNGFDQVIPRPPEYFQLRNGQLYEIQVSYSSGPVPARFRWVAE